VVIRRDQLREAGEETVVYTEVVVETAVKLLQREAAEQEAMVQVV